MDAFPRSVEVVGIDAFEDSALDLQRRTTPVQPYASLAATRRRSYAVAVGRKDSTAVFLGSLAKMHVSCCSNRGWCGRTYARLELAGTEHLCKLTRMRLGLVASDERVLLSPSRYPPNTARLPGHDVFFKVPCGGAHAWLAQVAGGGWFRLSHFWVGPRARAGHLIQDLHLVDRRVYLIRRNLSRASVAACFGVERATGCAATSGRATETKRALCQHRARGARGWTRLNACQLFVTNALAS
jgi:hypothetical protein